MLQHVTLELRRDDWPAAKAFWSIVGFEEVEPPGTLGERSAWVERKRHADPPPVAGRPGGRRPRVTPRSWWTTGTPSSPGSSDEGYEVNERPRHWGAARCFVRAPGGHRVELMAAPPT